MKDIKIVRYCILLIDEKVIHNFLKIPLYSKLLLFIDIRPRIIQK